MSTLWKLIKGFLMVIGLLWVVLIVLTIVVANFAETETIDRSGPAVIIEGEEF